MKRLIDKILFSYKSSILLLAVYAILMAIATVIEKYYGTPAAKEWIYYSPLFFLVHILLILNFIFTSIKRDLFKSKRWGFITIHASFIVILIGAMVSHIFSQEGIIHIREGEVENVVVVQGKEAQTVIELPFSLELVDFTLTRYPGSASASSYQSELLVHLEDKTIPALVYMNNILDVKGYRFYQASFDKDERGTILSVNRDSQGRIITYIGYALLLLGLILSLVTRNTRFRYLYGQLKSMHMILLLLLTLGLTTKLEAKEPSKELIEVLNNNKVDADHAAKFGSLALQSARGRIMPINTFSSEILRKVHKTTSVAGLSSDQFLISFILFPSLWTEYPLIEVSNEQIADKYGLTKGYCSYLDFFDDNGGYILQDDLDHVYELLQNDRSAQDKELLKLDERVNTLYQVLESRLLNIFPKADDKDHKWYAPGDDLSAFEGQDSVFVSRIMYWYLEEVHAAIGSSDWSKADHVLDMIETYQDAKSTEGILNHKKLRAEVKYNNMDIFHWCKRGFLICGGILLVLGFIGIFKKSKLNMWLVRILWFIVLFTFHYLMAGMTLRWYISGSAPSNSYETMIYVAWAVVCIGILFSRRSTITFALSTIFGGVILFVSSLSWLDPHISPLVPVLKSPWLISHVTVIITSYGFMGISMLLGITNLIMLGIRGPRAAHLQDRVKELTIINEMCLWLGLAFLAVGIFLGAIWANESWGRYWGWDPKEVWALITMVIYAGVLHLHLIKKYNNPWTFNFWATISFASVIMTYFGVNYLLSGMHSYGNTDGLGNFIYYLGAVVIAIIVLAMYSLRGYKKATSDDTKINS